MESDTLWFLLIDVSGSMGLDFAGEHDYRGRVETGHYRIKLDAAKRTLLKELEGISGKVIIIAFNHDSQIIFEGDTSNKEEIRKRVLSLEAGGGTDIAKALNQGLEFSIKAPVFEYRDMILITDGESDYDEAIQAAKKCKEMRISVNPVVIDADNDTVGFKVAEDISKITGGRLYLVKSDEGAQDLNLKFRNAINASKIDHEKSRYEAQQAEKQSSYNTRIAMITATAALIATIAGLLDKIIISSSMATSVVAAFVALTGIIFIFNSFAKTHSTTPLYRTEKDKYFPDWPKYGSKVRSGFIAGGMVCIILSVGLVMTTRMVFFSTAKRNVRPNSVKIEELYNEDQLDHLQMHDVASNEEFSRRDSLRRVKVWQLFESKELITGEDFFRAAVIYQRGADSSQYRMAHNWAKTAIEIDSTHLQAKRLAAELIRRYKVPMKASK